MYPSRKEGGERDQPPPNDGYYGGRGAGNWSGGGGGSDFMDKYVLIYMLSLLALTLV